MQRYQREIEEILRSMEFPEAKDAEQEESKPPESKKVGVDFWRTSDIYPAYRSSGSKPGQLLWISSLSLASALFLMPFASLLSAGLIVLSLVLMLMLLRRGQYCSQTGEDPTPRDLRWSDVTVHARTDSPGTSGMPRRLGDFMFWPK